MKQLAALFALMAVFVWLGCDVRAVYRQQKLERFDIAYASCVDTRPGPELREMLETGQNFTLEALACLSASIDSLYGPSQQWE